MCSSLLICTRNISRWGIASAIDNIKRTQTPWFAEVIAIKSHSAYTAIIILDEMHAGQATGIKNDDPSGAALGSEWMFSVWHAC